jgi:hypothetical protein
MRVEGELQAVERLEALEVRRVLQRGRGYECYT